MKKLFTGYSQMILLLLFQAMNGLMPSLCGQGNTVPGQETQVDLSASEKKWVLVIHGGAGGPPKGTYSAAEEAAYIENLGRALDTGSSILQSGGSGLDAVEAVVRYLEDCPLFNAGKGAVLNADGVAELDASIMDGKTMKAGAVAGVTTIKNPVSAARKVMENTPHVMLMGGGADAFAKIQKLQIVDPSYFITEPVLKKWEKLREEKEDQKRDPAPSRGTVGAVALDEYGNLAAATSTGGMMNKMPGRTGDSPIIGAGTYAKNSTCAVSCTGHGEYFIRNVVAYDISALIEYTGASLEDAANLVVMEKLKEQGATGGLIAVDKYGHFTMPFNTNAMFRGFSLSNGQKEISIY